MDIVSLKRYIFENQKIEFILNELGCQKIQYHISNGYFSATQPDGDNVMGVVIKNNEYLNYCSYSRNIGFDDNFDLITLVEHIKNKSFLETIKYLHKILGINYRWQKRIVTLQNKTDPLQVFKKHDSNSRFNVADIHILDESLLNDYIPMLHINWIREGVMPWTMKKFGLCYSYKRKRIIIPMRYWLTGELLGINARTTIENYEELDIKKFYLTPSYQKSMNLYGLYENYDSIQQAGYTVIFEAEKSVLKRDSLTDSTGVALSGHIISEEQVRILIGLNVDIIIALDKDIPLQEVRHICEKFYQIRNVFYIHDKWDLLGAKDSPADAKNKAYQFLMKYKVKYDADEHRQYLREMERK